MTAPSNADIRAGLMRICNTHLPSRPDSDGEIWCVNDDMEWPCEAFRQALLNLQFERLFDLLRLMMDAGTGVVGSDQTILQRAVHGDKAGQGKR